MSPIVPPAVVLYTALAVVATFVSRWTGRTVPIFSSPQAIVTEMSLGLALAAVILLVTSQLGRFRFGERLERALAETIGPLETRDVLILALVSGFGEELFFRGMLQPLVGYAVASVLFGILHVGPSRAFLPWTLFALAGGFLLGGIVELTGALGPAILAHFVVNFVNLGRLSARARELSVPVGAGSGV